MSRDTLYSNTNTSFDKQQNPLRTFELPCDREYVQMPIGACSYFLLSEYPVDVDVYVSLNPNRKDAFKVDNRNTGFKINDVYTREGVPSFVKDVYVWTEGITNLHDSQGKPASVKIVTSSIPSFEILNNSSINSIESIGQIGSINGLVGYPQGAITITDIIIPERRTPAIINGNLFGWHKEKAYTQNMQHINPGEEYILSCKGVIDPELTYLISADIGGKMNRHINLHFHAGVMLPESTTLDTPPNKMFSLMATSFSCVAAAMGENWVVTSTGLDNQESYQFSGDFIIKNFMDSEGNITFKVELTQHLGNDASTSAADITNTKATYQISAYRKG